MAGNIIHCLRSMLDYLVWELVVLNRCEPQGGPGGNQFPIYTEPPKKGFEQATTSDLAGVHDDHRAMIKWLQPYERRDELEVARNPLAGLVQLSNTDKHQFLHTPAVAIQSVADFEFGIRAVRDIASFGDNEIIGVGHMKRDAIFAWAEVTLTGSDPEVEMKGDAPLEVRFDDGAEVVSSLRNIGISVGGVFSWFEPLFETGKPGTRPAFRDA